MACRTFDRKIDIAVRWSRGARGRVPRWPIDQSCELILLADAGFILPGREFF